MDGAIAALARELGEICTPHAALALEGAQLEATLRPRSEAECAAALAALVDSKCGALIMGRGSKLAAANAPCRARVRLDTTALRDAPEIDLDEGVARFGAGEALAAIEAQLAGSIWRLPLDALSAESTLGGALASAALGPRFGHPRDAVLGLRVALANGSVVKSGGRVVKNVTGYDLGKLFVGSNGTLGVITSAWLRLRPRPERVEALIAPAPPDAALALGASRAFSARAAALVDAALAPALCERVRAPRVLAIELAGDEAAVAADRAALLAKLGAVLASADLAAQLRAIQGGGEIRFRVAVVPSELDAACRGLAAAGARTLAFPARGLAYAFFPDHADASAFGAQLSAVANTARRAGGAWKIEAAPLALRSGREVLGDPDGTLPLQRAVKRAYDPENVLNPGRGVGET